MEDYVGVALRRFCLPVWNAEPRLRCSIMRKIGSGNTCQFFICLDVRVPRIDCPTHGVRPVWCQFPGAKSGDASSGCLSDW